MRIKAKKTVTHNVKKKRKREKTWDAQPVSTHEAA